MPSAKPDKQEINSLRELRGIRYAEFVPRYFRRLCEHCEAATADGYVTPERASALLQYLESDAEVAAIYPNNILAEFLREATHPKHWSLDIEHDLLHVLFSLYLGYHPAHEGRSDIRFQISIDGDLVSTSSEPRPREPLPPSDLSVILTYAKLKSKGWLRPLLTRHFDSPSNRLELQNRFVGFTGKFKLGTRAACFDTARSLGAVPCDPTPYLDYLFVSEELEAEGALSSKISSAIYFRRLYGNPLILPESAWEASIAGG